jgi:hypothetical protein
MRTKTLLLTAVLGVATLASTYAQVYSVNAVGYVNVTVKAGQFAILANPLNQPTNSIPAVLPDVPANTIVYVYDPATAAFTQATKRSSGAWTGTTPAGTLLNPGQGFFIKNAGATDMTVTFVGEVPTGALKNPFVAGYNLIASQVPQAGKVKTDLGLPAVTNDQVHRFVNGAYDSRTLRASGSWTGTATGEPEVGVAEGFFYKATAAGSWDRTFSIQ